jgi:hypothetical protein
MQPTNNLQPETPSANGTAAGVLARITAEHVVPTPRYAFLMREYTVWGLWLASIALGALAVAVTIYDGLSATYALYEATHDNFWTFLVSVLPYLWLIVFAVMTVVAVRGLRATKRGYRYSTFLILGSSVVCSVFGGVLFHVFGFGFWLDNILGHQIDQYMSMEKMELGMWQAPDQGRLIGMLVATDTSADSSSTELTLQFQDASGHTWTISNDGLNERELALLQSKNRVRLLGTTTDATTFHICGVFPWMYARAMGWGEMQHERMIFEQTMAAHRRMGPGDGASTSGQVIAGAIPTDELCAHLKMMARMPR